MSPFIYLDYNATTSVDSRVLEAMLPYFTLHFGNAASHTHVYGATAAKTVQASRELIAENIGVNSGEIIFTSGATESLNTGILGIFNSFSHLRKHIIVSAAEHKAVLDTCKFLERKYEAELSILPITREGLTEPALFKAALRPDTLMACVMLANNETGVIQPIEILAGMAREANVFFVCDTTQAIGKINVNLSELGVDIACMSAHKMYGPKGIGALYVNRKTLGKKLTPLIHGGGHEDGLRSGTLNVPGIIGMAKAMELCGMEVWDRNAHISKLRTGLEQALTELSDVYINGSIRNRLPNTTNILIKNIPSTKLFGSVSGLAFSAGSACTSALPKSSHVLKAMGLSDEDASCSYRFSLGKDTNYEDVRIAGEQLSAAILKLRVSGS